MDPYDNPISKFSYQEGQVLLGSLLGDGSLWMGNQSRTPSFKEKHSIKQTEYLEWKAKELNRLGPKLKLRHYKEKRPYLQLSTPCLSDFLPLRHTFYPEGKKILPLNLLAQLGALGLAIWYMDDGSWTLDLGSQRGRGRLYTESFGQESNEWLAGEFFPQQFGLGPRVLSVKPKNPRWKTKFFLTFTRSETEKLLQIVEPYIHPSMRYKLGRGPLPI